MQTKKLLLGLMFLIGFINISYAKICQGDAESQTYACIYTSVEDQFFESDIPNINQYNYISVIVLGGGGGGGDSLEGAGGGAIGGIGAGPAMGYKFNTNIATAQQKKLFNLQVSVGGGGFAYNNTTGVANPNFTGNDLQYNKSNYTSALQNIIDRIYPIAHYQSNPDRIYASGTPSAMAAGFGGGPTGDGNNGNTRAYAAGGGGGAMSYAVITTANSSGATRYIPMYMTGGGGGGGAYYFNYQGNHYYEGMSADFAQGGNCEWNNNNFIQENDGAIAPYCAGGTGQAGSYSNTDSSFAPYYSNWGDNYGIVTSSVSTSFPSNVPGITEYTGTNGGSGFILVIFSKALLPTAATNASLFAQYYNGYSGSNHPVCASISGGKPALYEYQCPININDNRIGMKICYVPTSNNIGRVCFTQTSINGETYTASSPYP